MGSQGSMVASKVIGLEEIGHRAQEDVPEKQGSDSLSLTVWSFREKIESICSSQNKTKKMIMILKSHNYMFMEA